MNTIIRTLFILTVFTITSCTSSKKTSPYEFALMSADVYDKEEAPALPAHIQPFLDFDAEEFRSSLHLDLAKVSDLIEEKNWKTLAPYVIGKFISKGGYSGRAYLNTQNHQIIIAHRGTDIAYYFDEQQGLGMTIDNRIWETIKDLDDNMDILKGKIPQQQLEAARFFTEKARETYKEKYPGKEVRILHTGHSLGAVLAELMAVEGHTEAITFESPGSYPMVQELIRKDSLKKPSYKITTYNTLPNAINRINPPAGEVIYLIENPETKYSDTLDSESITVTLSSHSIREVLSHFDPKSGKPRQK